MVITHTKDNMFDLCNIIIGIEMSYSFKKRRLEMDDQINS